MHDVIDGRRGRQSDHVDVPLGGHVCFGYRDEDEYGLVLAQYAREGLDAGERVVCFVPAERRDLVFEVLLAAGHDPRDLQAAGRLHLCDAEHVYGAEVPDFSPERLIASLGSIVDRSLAAGHLAVRVFGEPPDVLRVPEVAAQWPGYEFRVELLAKSRPLRVLCAFDRSRVSREDAAIVAALHGGLPLEGSSALRISATEEGGVALRGELDLSGVELIRRVVLESLPALRAPVIDLSELRFADLAGSRTIQRLAEAMSERFGSVRISNPPRTLERVWELVGYPVGRVEISVPERASEIQL